jgi:hypothetical protein
MAIKATDRQFSIDGTHPDDRRRRLCREAIAKAIVFDNLSAPVAARSFNGTWVVQNRSITMPRGNIDNISPGV